MKENTTLWPFSVPPEPRAGLAGLAGFAALAAVASCATPPDPPPSATGRASEPAAQAAPAAAPAGTTTWFVSSAGASAEVSRVTAPDGSETLHGETVVALGPGAPRCIVEDVTLDARGALVRADVSSAASCNAEPEMSAHLDPARVLARVTEAAGTPGDEGSAHLAIPGAAGPDAPWIYTAALLPGRPLTTPVAAWVALRAAAISPSLTLIELEHRAAYRVPADQVAVPTELGTTVVLGDDGADVGVGFVERIRMGREGLTLVSLDETAKPPAPPVLAQCPGQPAM